MPADMRFTACKCLFPAMNPLENPARFTLSPRALVNIAKMGENCRRTANGEMGESILALECIG